MDDGLKDRIQKIDALVSQIRDASDPRLRDAALELVQTVMEFHAAGIDRMMEIADAAGDVGWQIIDGFARDELVSHVLLLHGLHPSDLETRVREALEKVRPMLHSHGGNVELIGISGSVVRLRLVGSCSGCPSSTVTLRTAIEKAIYEMAPEMTSIECEGASELVAIHNAI
jgi:Fe-S cluster biogenesis protein NfuA